MRRRDSPEWRIGSTVVVIDDCVRTWNGFRLEANPDANRLRDPGAVSGGV